MMDLDTAEERETSIEETSKILRGIHQEPIKL